MILINALALAVVVVAMLVALTGMHVRWSEIWAQHSCREVDDLVFGILLVVGGFFLGVYSMVNLYKVVFIG